VTRAIDEIGRRVWLNMAIAAVVRGLWLPFVIGAFAIAVQFVRGESFAPQVIAWVWALTIPLSLVFAYTLRPNRARTAAMLDRTFALQDRLVTALERPTIPHGSRSDRVHLSYLQLADSANVATGLKTDPRFRPRLPAREISLAILAGLLMLALLFLRGVGGELPALGETSVPRFVPAAERRTAAAGQLSSQVTVRPPTVAEIQAASERSSSATADLNALAEALEANALTQPAADAIQAGNYAAAAQELRDSAQQAANLPQDSRDELAAALDQAAAATSNTSPSLSSAASEAANGLQEGGQSTTSSMQDLGDAVELAGESVVPTDVLASQMQQAQQAEASGADQGADAAGSQGSASNPGGASNPQAGQGGEAGDPIEGGAGSGADAAGGSSDAQPGESSSGAADNGGMVDAASGSADQSSAGAFGDEQPGGAGQPGGDGTNPGQAGNQAGDQSGSQGDDGPMLESDAPNQTGAGASSAGSDLPSDENTSQAGSGQLSGDTSVEDLPAESDLNDAAAAAGAGTAPTVTANESIGLSDPGGGDSFQLGGGGSASSLGSGAGVMVAGGDATQAEVAEAGPESNRTPADYRTIVENYFARD
jgi:hypothetical protein